MVSTTLQTYLNTTDAIHADILIYIKARDFTTNAVVNFGFWTGDDHQTFTIGGASRLYYGAGALADVESEAFRYEMGLDVLTWTFEGSMGAPEFENMVRGYNLTLAECEVHRAVWNHETNQLVEEPHAVWVGRVQSAPIVDDADGATRCRVVVISNAIDLTLTRPETRSDAFYRQNRSGDRIFRHVDISRSNTASTAWGVKS
jgi:hypothetical protein